MNRSAIRDLLGSVLSTWCRSVAEWTPPGALSGEQCSTCHASLAGRALDLSAWPHGLVHELVTSIETTIWQVSESIAEDAMFEGSRPTFSIDDRRGQSLRQFVLAVVMEHRADMVDVLTQCVEPRLDAYVREEAERGLARQLGR